MTALPTGHKLFMGQHMRLVERTGPVTLGEFCVAWLLSGSTGERQVSQGSGSQRARNAFWVAVSEFSPACSKARYRQTDQQTQRYQRALWVNRGPAQERPVLKNGTSTAP